MKRAALAAALLLAAAPAAAHEVKLADGRTVDYTGITGPYGGDCCGNRDCRIVESRWLPDNTLLVETAPDVWLPVPPDRIIIPVPEELRETSDKTHACWTGAPATPKFNCVFPEANSS